jgi:hypothetical protein
MVQGWGRRNKNTRIRLFGFIILPLQKQKTMKKLLILLLISNVCYGQIIGTYADVSAMKSQGALYPNQVYCITDLGKMQIMAKTNNSFYRKPYVRTIFAMDFDEETFDFDTKRIMGIDNVSCVVRCTNGTWSILNDIGHTPENVASVSDNLFIYFTKTYDKVIGFQTSLDETYAGSNYDITCGASTGLAFCVVLFYKTVIINGQLIKQFITLQELSIPNSNITYSGRFGKFIQL